MSADAQQSGAGDGRLGLFSIDVARMEERSRVAELLKIAGLPYEDVVNGAGTFLVAHREGEMVGAIGAEVYREDALLRSFVVRPDARGQGLGHGLVRELERVAETWGVRRWWLLTTTAEAFFVKRGFHVVPRASAPAAIAATEEFRGLCPSVAVCLTRERGTE